MKKLVYALALSSLSILVGGCGGDDDDTVSTAPPPPPAVVTTAEGLWIGKTDTNRSVTGLVLDDGTYYVLYSTLADPDAVGGIVQGHGTSNNGSFTSTDARDFNLEGAGVLEATISASYTERQSFNGSVMYTAGGATTFTTTYDSAYELTPSLTALAGTYKGTVAFSLGFENATIQISDTGGITGAGESGCTLTGTASPRTSGNVFNLSITFGGAPCYFAGETLTGIAYYEGDLFAAAPNATRTDGVLFIGEKL